MRSGIYAKQSCEPTDLICHEFFFPDNNNNDMYFPDLNADGYPELCIRKESGIECHINQLATQQSLGAMYTLTPQIVTTICSAQGTDDGGCSGSYFFSTIQFLDLNADGKSDLVYHTPSGVQYLYSTGTGFQARINSGICKNKNGSLSCHNIRYPDVNGDSIPDMCWREDSGIKCRAGTGAGFTSSKIINTDICATGSTRHGICNGADNYDTIQYADINGDGKADLTYRGDQGIQSWISTGTAFVDRHATGICRNGDPARCENASLNWSTIKYPDINGDGMADLAYRSVHGFRAFISNGKTPNVIHKISDGYKNQTDITYSHLTDNTVHTACSNASYPERCLKAPLNVVSSYKASNGINGQGEYSYHYEGSKLHLRGRGLLGFSKITKTDLQTNIITSTWADNTTKLTLQDSYADFYPYLGMLTRKTTSLNGVVLTEVDNTRNHYSTMTGALPYFPYYPTSTEYSHDYDSSTIVSKTVTENFFDEAEHINNNAKAGNLTRVISTTTDETGLLGYTEKTFIKTTVNKFDDIVDATHWQVGRLISTEVTHSNNTGDPADDIIRTSTFDYNAQGLLTTTVAEPGDPNLELTTVNHYDDPYGTVTKVVTSGNAGALHTVTDRQTRNNYVANTVNGLLPQLETFNSLDQSETKTLDARFGVVTNLVGPNSLATSWEYDDFGRKLRENRADGSYSTITRSMCKSDCLAVAGMTATITPTYKVTTENFGTLPVTVYYDSLDREIRTESINVTGNTVYSDTIYDAKGRINKASQPYYAGTTNSENWVEFIYDDLNRPVEEIQHGTNLVKKKEYSPLTVKTTVTNYSGLNTAEFKEHVKIKTNFVSGKLRLVSENKDDTNFINTTYQYDAVGNLLQVNAPNSLPVIMDYDAKGRFKVAMNDPDMGSWSYEHDVFGQLRRQTNAKLQQTDMVYDDLGRMVLRLEEEGATVWQYDTAANGIGKLDTVTGPIALTATELAAQRSAPSITNALAAAIDQTYSRSAQYDDKGRAIATVTNIDGTPFEMSTSYDPVYSRVDIVTYPETVKEPIALPTRLTTKNIYDDNGFLIRLENAANNSVYWRLGDADGAVADAVNARGQTEVESYGNGLTTRRLFNPVLGHLETISTGSAGLGAVQNLEYVFDSIGNLEQRLDRNRQFVNPDQTTDSIVETFSYDHLNRLTSTT